MNGDILLMRLKYFVKYVHPTEGSRAFLILDDRCSHKEVPVILCVRADHLHRPMLSSVPRITHKQPLDGTFMKPFNAACASWMRINPELKTNEYDVAQLIIVAYRNIFLMEITQK
jgi:hypothetical protein